MRRGSSQFRSATRNGMGASCRHPSPPPAACPRGDGPLVRPHFHRTTGSRHPSPPPGPGWSRGRRGYTPVGPSLAFKARPRSAEKFPKPFWDILNAIFGAGRGSPVEAGRGWHDGSRPDELATRLENALSSALILVKIASVRPDGAAQAPTLVETAQLPCDC
jgi:hypothetical protein